MYVFDFEPDGGRQQLSALRDFAAGWTLVLGGGTEVAEEVRVVVSELATNVLRVGTGGSLVVSERDRVLHLWLYPAQQELRGLEQLTRSAAAVVADVTVVTKRLPGARRWIPNGRRQAVAWLGERAVAESEAWRPPGRRVEDERMTFDCFTTVTGRRAVLATRPLKAPAADLDDEGGRGLHISSMLMDSCGVGLLATTATPEEARA